MSRRGEEITPPFAGKTSWAIAGSAYGTASWIQVPAPWFGRMVRLEADGADWYFTLGTAVTTVSETAVSTVTSNAFSAQGSVATKVKDGGYKDLDFRLIEDAPLVDGVPSIRIAVKCPSAAGYLRFELVSGPVQVRG